MADFRKWFYALAMVGLIVGLTVPASAQIAPFSCSSNVAVTPTVRSQGYTEIVGDILLICTNGTSTAAGALVPSANITVSLNTNITSKLTSTSGGFDEALLIVDEPNAPGPNSNRPVLNCGNTGAPDSSTSSGPGVCAIYSDGNPQDTYNGAAGMVGTSAATTVACGAAGSPTGVTSTSSFGCGRPNVFQGRAISLFGTGAANSVTFSGVPIDPPGTGGTRTLRFTNIRADAEFLPVTSPFSPPTITASISTNGTTSVGINISTVAQPVAQIASGLLPAGTSKGDTNVSRTADIGTAFVQCNSELPTLSASKDLTISSSLTAASGGGNTQFGPTGILTSISLQEGFQNAWKTKNIAYVLANGNANGSGAGYVYNGSTVVPTGDAWQNVPGASYNTESGFEYASSTSNLTGQNPPLGVGTTPVTGATNTGYALSDASTGIASAGVANQGTRLALNFSSVPTQANIWTQPILYLYRQGAGSASCNSLAYSSCNSGVMVLVSTDANGDGSSSTPSVPSTNALVQVSNNLAVWEILFSDTSTSEQVDIPLVVQYVSNLTMNLPSGYPTPNQVAQVTPSFAPFYGGSFSPNPRFPTSSTSLPVPRFVPGTQFLNAFVIERCACNLLFPFVSNQPGFDTGIAIANTTLDPGAAAGFHSTGPQTGTITLYYYGDGANNSAQPAPQTSNAVGPGQVLTYVLSTGGGAIYGSGVNTASGFNGSAAGFVGYIIAQSQFQYCHGFAFINTPGVTSGGLSTGYLGIVLDAGTLPRTSQIGENDGH